MILVLRTIKQDYVCLYVNKMTIVSTLGVLRLCVRYILVYLKKLTRP